MRLLTFSILMLLSSRATVSATMWLEAAAPDQQLVTPDDYVGTTQALLKSTNDFNAMSPGTTVSEQRLGGIFLHSPMGIEIVTAVGQPGAAPNPTDSVALWFSVLASQPGHLSIFMIEPVQSLAFTLQAAAGSVGVEVFDADGVQAGDYQIDASLPDGRYRVAIYESGESISEVRLRLTTSGYCSLDDVELGFVQPEPATAFTVMLALSAATLKRRRKPIH